MKAIYKREFRSYFNSMIGYVFVAIITFFISLFYMALNLYGGYPYFSYTLYSLILLFAIGVPIITMKSMAEERRLKTDQMLLTYPVKITSIIMGKYLAMMTVYAIPLLISCLFPLIIVISGGTGSLLIDYSTILAFLCLGSLFVAIGMFISSLTESQIIAIICSIGVLILLFFWSSLIQYIPTTALASLIGFMLILMVIELILYHLTHNKLLTILIGIVVAGVLIVVYLLGSELLAGLLPNILSIFAITDIIANFAGYYVFDLRGLFMILSVSALFVFLSVQSVQKRRWS